MIINWLATHFYPLVKHREPIVVPFGDEFWEPPEELFIDDIYIICERKIERKKEASYYVLWLEFLQGPFR